MMLKSSRAACYALTALIYAAAASLGAAAARSAQGGLYAKILIGDAAATLFVYITGLIISNASVYDPYWSVAPMVILPVVYRHTGNMGAGGALLLAAVLFWGVRLTANWAVSFHDFTRQDWRYDMLKEKSGRFYPLVSLFGIHLFPTLVVFLCLLPAVYAIENGVRLNAASLCGFALCVAGTLLSLVSDAELRRFRRVSSRNDIIRSGLWKYARHPNYLGEIIMWWGVFVFSLAVSPFEWYLPVGAAVNTLMFVFISIPMAEKRMASYKNGFSAYKKETRMLFPVKKRI